MTTPSYYKVTTGLQLDLESTFTTGIGGPSGVSQNTTSIGSLYMESNTATNLLNIWYKFQSTTSTIADWAQLASKAYVDAHSGSGTVTSVNVSGGTTGLTTTGGPVTTTGTITLTGTLGTSNGGTGLSMLGGINEILGVNAAGTALEYKVLVAGTNVSIVNTGSQITINASGGGGSQPLTGNALAYAPPGTLNVTTVNSSRITTGPSGVDLAIVATSGTYEKVTIDQYGRVVIGSQLVALDIITALGYTPIADNPNLDALATTNTNGIYVITGSGTSATREIAVPNGMSIANADGVAGNPTISLTSNLAAIETLATTGLTAYNNSSGLFSGVTLIPPPVGFTISSPDGVAGNPTFALDGELAGVQDITGLGLAVHLATGLWETTTIQGTTNQINVQFGDGLAGDPTISIAPNPAFTGTGSITLPSGTTIQQPATPTQGMFRYNSQTQALEYYDSVWETVADRTFVQNGFQPLAPNLTALAGTSGVGIYVLTGAGTSVLRSITSNANTLTVTNANGFSGNINVDISTSYPGQGSITTVGTITSGAWQSTTISPTFGGTGLTSLGAANQILGMNTVGSALEYKSVVAGAGISVTPVTGQITIANTGVTSITAGTGIDLNGTTGDLAISTYVLYAENPQPGYTPPAVLGNNAVAIGFAANAGAAKSLAIGEQSQSRITGGVVQASGRFTTTGDAQTGKYLVRTNTVNNVPTEAFVDGTLGSIRLVLPDNSTWTFRITVTAHRTDAGDGHAGYEVLGVIYRQNGAATTQFQGAPSVFQIASNNQVWNVNVTADSANGCLGIFFTGETSKVIRWLAVVETVEITG